MDRQILDGPTPYIVVRNADAAIAFYQRAFGAREVFRLTEPGGHRIGHAELEFEGSRLFLADEFPDFGAVAPDSVGGTSVKFHLRVADAEAVFRQALEEGATELRKLSRQFYGELSGLLADPFGYSWFIAQRIEEVSPLEMQKRWDSMSA